MSQEQPSLGGRIFRDSTVVSIVSIGVQGISFFASLYIAVVFGATWQTDAFYLAFTIPLFALNLVRQAIKSVFVPVFVEYKRREPGSVTTIIGGAFSLVTTFAVGVTLLIAFATPAVMSMATQGFSTAGTRLTIQLTWELLPILPLMCIASILSATLNAYQRFILPAVTPAIEGLIKIITVWFLAPQLGIHGLAVGIVLGGVGEVLLLGVGLWQAGLPLRPVAKPHPGLVRMLHLAMFPFLGSILSQLNPFVDRVVATLLPPGNITSLNYAERITSLPGLLVTAGFFTVILSYWSELAVTEGTGGLRRALRSAIAMIVFISVPLASLLFVFRYPLVRLLLQRGQFDQAAAAQTSLALGYLALGIVPNFVFMLLIRACLALQDTRSPMVMGIVNGLLNLVLDLLLVRPLGLGGIALSTTLTLMTLAIMLWLILARRLHGLMTHDLLSKLGFIMLGGVAAGGSAYVAYCTMQTAVHVLNFWTTAASLLLASGIGMAFYVTITLMLKIEEAAKIWALVQLSYGRYRSP